jgi:methanethiol S-methyltransferase
MQKKTEPRPSLAPMRVRTRAIAVACLVLAILGQGLFMLRVLRLGLGWEAEAQASPAAAAWLINLSGLALFGLQHSGMARAGFKSRWMRLLPACLERAVYVGLSGALLTGLALMWQPLPGEPLWDGPTWLVALAVLGAIGMGCCCPCEGPARFFGLRQVWQPEAPASDTLRIVGPYRFVRHPLMLCMLVFLWGHPVMTLTLAVLSGGLTLYVLVAIRLEERDLLRRFGTAYAEYRHRVPMLIPWRRPAPATVHAALE